MLAASAVNTPSCRLPLGGGRMRSTSLTSLHPGGPTERTTKRRTSSLPAKHAHQQAPKQNTDHYITGTAHTIRLLVTWAGCWWPRQHAQQHTSHIALAVEDDQCSQRKHALRPQINAPVGVCNVRGSDRPRQRRHASVHGWREWRRVDVILQQQHLPPQKLGGVTQRKTHPGYVTRFF